MIIDVGLLLLLACFESLARRSYQAFCIRSHQFSRLGTQGPVPMLCSVMSCGFVSICLVRKVEVGIPFFSLFFNFFVGWYDYIIHEM